MYINDGVSISKASDGTFLISCRIKKKGKKEKSKDTMPISVDSNEEKTLTAATAEEALAKIGEMLPTLENGCMPEEAFKNAFKEAAGSE